MPTADFPHTNGPPTRVVCSLCGKSVVTDLLRQAPLVCAMVGWAWREGRALCTLCQWQEGEVPKVARRLRSEAMGGEPGPAAA